MRARDHASARHRRRGAARQKPPANEVRASGHVEATDVRLAPEVGGRIVLLTVKEGDRVEAGTLILRLDGRDQSSPCSAPKPTRVRPKRSSSCCRPARVARTSARPRRRRRRRATRSPRRARN